MFQWRRNGLGSVMRNESENGFAPMQDQKRTPLPDAADDGAHPGAELLGIDDLPRWIHVHLKVNLPGLLVKRIQQADWAPKPALRT
jgi:hypothetical protein